MTIMTSTFNVRGASINEKNVKEETKEILLPYQHDSVFQIAVDIGGSLAKVIYYSKSPTSGGGRLNFKHFESQHIEQCFQFIKEFMAKNPTKEPRIIKATGGGAHMYEKDLQQLGAVIHKEDEMESIISGLNFLLKEIPNEIFSYSREGETKFEQTPSNLFPYLLVNIGSGISILKVTAYNDFERVSGSSLGGGTFWGLLSVLTECKSFNEMLELSKVGDNSTVDMLVGDIYGVGYDKVGLKSNIIASSFGKLFKLKEEERKNKVKSADLCQALLYMLSNNIAQIAFYNAQLHGIKQIYFGGSFIRGHPITMRTLSYGVKFWSKGGMQAHFLRHEGYLGALGAYLKHDFVCTRRQSFSFSENFTFTNQISKSSLNAYGVIEQLSEKLVPFPSLSHPDSYHPDTFIINDPAFAEYWIDQLKRNIEKLIEMAVMWSADSEDAKSRGKSFDEVYRGHLENLRQNPNFYGALTVRSLLDLREQCLKEMGFLDIFNSQKALENREAILELPSVLHQIDNTPESKKLEQLLDNVLGGNMFDWGATRLSEILEAKELSFESAKSKIVKSGRFFQCREFIQSFESGNPYKKIVIFVDNSGADFVLGITPLVRYFLQKGSEVIISANTEPAVNDITAQELKELLPSIENVEPLFKEAICNRTLKVIPNGSGSPCLDLRRIDEKLSAACTDVDLVILEGMGRALLTNFHAHFKCDSLKIGAVKNKKLAELLHTSLYEGVCIFQAKEGNRNSGHVLNVNDSYLRKGSASSNEGTLFD